MLGELKPKGPKGPPTPECVPVICVVYMCTYDVYTYICQTKTSYAPLEDHPLATHLEPSALYCWILEILYCTPKGRRALLRIPSTEGRSACLCWAKSKPEGPEGSIAHIRRRGQKRGPRNPNASSIHPGAGPTSDDLNSFAQIEIRIAGPDS